MSRQEDVVTLATGRSRLVLDASDVHMWEVLAVSEVAIEDVEPIASELQDLAPAEAGLLLWDVAPGSALDAVATAGGWTLWSAKAMVGCDLGDVEPFAAPGWSTTSLAELGVEEFAAVMGRAAEGDPFETSTPESATDDLHSLIADVGDAHHPEAWVVVADGDGEVGVVLPQPYPDDPETGTLLYLGVLPERRGQGLGAALHLVGMDRLRDLGVKRYVDSTDLRNAQMLRIFERNGAVEEGSQHLYGR